MTTVFAICICLDGNDTPFELCRAESPSKLAALVDTLAAAGALREKRVFLSEVPDYSPRPDPPSAYDADS